MADDLYSLRLTIAALLNGCRPTWDMQPFLQSQEMGEDTQMYVQELHLLVTSRDNEVNKLFDTNKVQWCDSQLVEGNQEDNSVCMEDVVF